MWKQQKVSKRESEIKRSGSSNGHIQNHTQNFERSWEMADRKMTYIYTHTNNRKNGRRQQKNTHQCYILWNWNAGAHIHKGEMWYILLNPRKIPVHWEHCVWLYVWNMFNQMLLCIISTTCPTCLSSFFVWWWCCYFFRLVCTDSCMHPIPINDIAAICVFEIHVLLLLLLLLVFGCFILHSLFCYADFLYRFICLQYV